MKMLEKIWVVALAFACAQVAFGAKVIYLLVPPDYTEWVTSVPMISLDGGQTTGKAMTLDPDKCGWYYYEFSDEEPTDQVLFYRDDDDERTDMIGNNGNWEESDTATWIPLKSYFERMSDSLYFVPDENQFYNEGDDGWYTFFPDYAEGVCRYELAALIYDTDASLHGAFTCAPTWTADFSGNPELAYKNACPTSAPYQIADGSGNIPCLGVTPGMVTEYLDHDETSATYKKPRLTDEGRKCFGTKPDEAFAAMFNSTPGVNETYCFDMPLRRGSDGKWEFISDTYNGPYGAEYPVPGGFYPAEKTPLYKMLSDYLPAAENKRKAEGPVFMSYSLRQIDVTEGFPKQDLLCNGPGWSGGINCTGLFKGGSEFSTSVNRIPIIGDGWSWSFFGPGWCGEDLSVKPEGCYPTGWTFYKENTEIIDMSKDADGLPKGSARWLSGERDPAYDAKVYTDGRGRNQHFCFESHARFTHKSGSRLSFSGDDDIWVYIDNRLAVDIGGTHLAAPGYVDLDRFKGESGTLVPGATYDLDIFFCDRRTTMSNVRIKTNLQIKQSYGISIDAKSLGGGNLELDVCVMKTGGGDCASVVRNVGGEKTEECRDDISAQVDFAILTRKKQPVPGCDKCSALTPYSVNFGGIDLTNPKVPRINQEKIAGLEPGTYYLAITVSGKRAFHKFKVGGGFLGIVDQDVVFENVDNEISAYRAGTKWKFAGSAMAGTRVPIYISAPVDGYVDLISASGQGYTLSLSAGARLYRTKDPADVTPIATPYSGTVNETGIDTLWVEVPLAGMASSEQIVTATVGNTSATITFYLPKLTFAEPATKDSEGNVLTWNPVKMDPDMNEDGDEYYHWVGAEVELHVVVLNPTTGDLCRECDFTLDILDASKGVSGAASQFDEGVALVRIRSNSEYSAEAASVIVGSIVNDAIAAPYGNMHFYTPTSPMPVVADIFDVKGKSLGQMSIPLEFYSETADYLDGRADSLAIIYDRKIHEDSIPTFICLNFDEKNLEKINPYEMGISNNSKDKELYCSTQFDADDVKKAYDRSPDGGRTLVFSVDEPFSAGVKTSVNLENKIVSFTKYVWKGKEVRTFYEKSLTDRMAPIILSAHTFAETEGGANEKVMIALSEPVSVVNASLGSQAFSYYLNSAVDVTGESARYRHVESLIKPQNMKDTLTLRYKTDDKDNPPPHVGDYIRFRADQLVWADATDGNDSGSDTLRPASDAEYHWNSPTDYNSTKRLPSPWVQVKGGAVVFDPDNPDIKFASPSFHIKMTGPFQFTIVMDENISPKASKFTVMDLQGRILREGVITSKETGIPLLSKGSYIVRVGLGYQRVNVR